jgi:predicted amidohydrolase
MRLMLAQTNPICGDVKSNLNELARLCQQAQAIDADILALPELALSGYNIFDQLHQLAEPEGGSIAIKIADLAREYRLHLLLGLAERRADQRIANAAVLFDDQGQRLATYHKRQLWDKEHQYFVAGEELCVVDTRLGRIGLMICYDNEFPEISRALAQQRAEIILSPTVNMIPNAERQQIQVRARAMDNQVFVACINRVGVEGELHYCGHSLVAGPDGEVLGQLGDEADTLVIDIDLNRINESRIHQDYLKDLRLLPGVYV